MQKELAALISDDDFEKIELALKEPNIFSALSIHRMEIRHSNFLGYLLNPNENHGLHDLFLKKVLRDIFYLSPNSKRSIIDADYINYANAEIRKEWRNIDLLIILEDDVVVIENKIDSNDHSNQLQRYKEIVDSNFEDKTKHYVYLTPFGNDPTDEKSKEDYTNYSYENISEIIESILKLYKNSLSEKVYFYMSDYSTVLKREILMSEELNEEARKVYLKHKAAIDFIYENAPNPMNEIIFPAIKNELRLRNYIIKPRGSRIFRFTTKELDALLPKSGKGWKGNDLFLFELIINENNIRFSSVISPGDESLRNVIVEELRGRYKQSTAKQWLQFAIKKYDFSKLEESAQEEKESVEKKITGIINKIKPTVDDISALINGSAQISEAINRIAIKNVSLPN